MRSVTELLEHLMRGLVAVQDYNSPVCCRNAAVLLQPALMHPIGLIDQAVRTESGQDGANGQAALNIDSAAARGIWDRRLAIPQHGPAIDLDFVGFDDSQLPRSASPCASLAG